MPQSNIRKTRFILWAPQEHVWSQKLSKILPYLLRLNFFLVKEQFNIDDETMLITK